MSREFAGKHVEPGQKVFTSIALECRHDRVELPLFLVNGANAGPTLLLLSGEHGTEVTGPETVRRFIERLDPAQLRGAVAAVPVANPLAMRTKQHSYPYDRWAWFSSITDMSSAWPGKPDGTTTQRIVHVLFEQLVTKADAMVSLHSTNFKPYLGYVPGDDKARQLCLDYGRISCICEQSRPGGAVVCASAHGVPAFLVEWPPLRHVNDAAVEESVIGLQNVAISLGMLTGTLRKVSDQFVVDYATFSPAEVSAADDGVFVREKPWGAQVREGEVIGRLYDLYTYRETQLVCAPCDGILFHTGPSPGHLATFFMHTDSVCEGQAVANVVPFREHIRNPGGDPWGPLLMGGPAPASATPFQ